jgi:hypothetical protein
LAGPKEQFKKKDTHWIRHFRLQATSEETLNGFLLNLVLIAFTIIFQSVTVFGFLFNCGTIILEFLSTMYGTNSP